MNYPQKVLRNIGIYATVMGGLVTVSCFNQNKYGMGLFLKNNENSRWDKSGGIGRRSASSALGS